MVCCPLYLLTLLEVIVIFDIPKLIQLCLTTSCKLHSFGLDWTVWHVHGGTIQHYSQCALFILIRYFTFQSVLIAFSPHSLESRNIGIQLGQFFYTREYFLSYTAEVFRTS